MTDALYLQAEQAVLGALLVDPGIAAELFLALRPDDFLDDDYRAICETARALFADGTPIAALTIGAKLGPEATTLCRELIEITPTAAVWPEYVKVLRECAARERARGLVAQLRLELEQGSGRAGLRTLAEQLTETLSDDRDKRTYTLTELMTGLLSHVGETPVYLDWGFDKLNQHIFAQGGEYIILGARPSAGKTALALQLGLHFAQHRRVLFFSLETDPDKTAARIAAAQTQTDFRALKTGALSQDQLTVLAHGCRALAGRSFTFVDAAGLTVPDLRARILRERAEVVIIDYLQLIDHPNRRLSEYDRVTDISRQIQRLCKTLHVTALVLSQLSRIGVYDEPDMSHLRSSGQLEQDADVIAFLYKPDPDEGRSVEEIADAENRRWLKIAKNKEGVTGKTKFWFDGSVQRFAQEWEGFYGPIVPMPARKTGHAREAAPAADGAQLRLGERRT